MNYSGGGTTHASSLPSKVKKSDKKLDPNSLNEDAYAVSSFCLPDRNKIKLN